MKGRIVAVALALAISFTTLIAAFLPDRSSAYLEGRAEVGATLQIRADIPSGYGEPVRYVWIRGALPIEGASTSSYVATPADVGKRLWAVMFFDIQDGVNWITTRESAPIKAAAITGGGSSGGGGGGGGGGGAPAVQAPAPPVTTNLIPEGKSLVVVGTNGVALEVKSEVTQDAKELSLSFGTVTLDLAAQSGATFTKEGKATISAGANLSLSAEGYQPSSVVTGYLVPAASLATSSFAASSTEIIELGTAAVDALGSFTYDAKITAPAGSYVMQLLGTTLVGEKITIALETTIQADTETKTWAKRLPGNTEAKLYAKNIVGAGKVVFKVNGKEIAWVRAVDATDPKLRVITEGPMTGANYLVRTVKLNMGKNILEIYIDGERTTRVAYSRK